MDPRRYIAIDLKSFYASVECVERGLDPLDTNLVVADPTRTDKTICLAVSPSLKALGISGRARLFEVKQRVAQANYERRFRAPSRRLQGASVSARQLAADPAAAIDFIVAPPRMALYIDYSAQIYDIYLRHVAQDDIVSYSIDEVFIDATPYLRPSVTAHSLALAMIRDVLSRTGITATAGIGTNLYLCKIAMDIMAKRMAPDTDGVRIAELDESAYRRELWSHRPLTDFWRVGHGIQSRLAPFGIHTMGDIARLSLTHEDFFFKLLGVNAELLLDHAWGREPVGMEMIKAYRPETFCTSSGQVLQTPYPAPQALVVLQEMAQDVALDLLDKRMVTDQIVLDIGYDIENLTDPLRAAAYTGDVHTDRYGRRVPRPAHGSRNLGAHTLSAAAITRAATELFHRIANPALLIRRLTITANHLLPEGSAPIPAAAQPNLFTDPEEEQRRREADEKERRLMEATLSLKKRFGKNALLRGLDYQEGATGRDRNNQIGGHKA